MNHLEKKCCDGYIECGYEYCTESGKHCGACHQPHTLTPYSVLREKVEKATCLIGWTKTAEEANKAIMSHIDEYRENIAVEFEEKIRFSIRERASVWQKAATIIRRT